MHQSFPPGPLDPLHVTVVREKLLAWFAANGRDLPWRHTRDPYRVLVAEVMLQQTQVERVIPKYHAFLHAFPTLEALAGAPTAEVIKLWAGLGYNRRAINLQRTARAVCDDYDGRFPREPEVLLKLPGIGPYSAGAIACFAFEQDVAFIDTNIRRVLRRLQSGPDELARPAERELLFLAREYVPPGQGWSWNQAIMELGALICTSATPACRRCPLRDECRTYATRLQADAQVFRAAEPAYTPRSQPTRRAAERREPPYEGSRRFFRGRIVDALRALAAGQGLAFARLGPLIKPEYSAADEPWLRELVAGLARDGLLVIDGETVRLP